MRSNAGRTAERDPRYEIIEHPPLNPPKTLPFWPVVVAVMVVSFAVTLLWPKRDAQPEAPLSPQVPVAASASAAPVETGARDVISIGAPDLAAIRADRDRRMAQALHGAG